MLRLWKVILLGLKTAFKVWIECSLKCTSVSSATSLSSLRFREAVFAVLVIRILSLALLYLLRLIYLILEKFVFVDHTLPLQFKLQGKKKVLRQSVVPDVNSCSWKPRQEIPALTLSPFTPMPKVGVVQGRTIPRHQFQSGSHAAELAWHSMG